MEIVGKKKYKKCKPSEDKSSVICISYIPDKDGNKKVVATGTFTKSPDGEVITEEHDGDPREIEELTKHAIKYLKPKKEKTGDF